MQFNFFSPIKYNGVLMADMFRPYGSYFDDIISKFILRKYVLTGSPRPEHVSTELYGDPKYFWIILLTNKIYDPFHDWIKSEEAVHQSTIQKYKNYKNGVDEILYHMNDKAEMFFRLVEHPEDSGLWYDEGDKEHKYLQYKGTLVPITAIEHELSVNESRRIIDIIAPNDLSRFLDEYSRMMEKIRNGN